jgi:hypothetical protein
VAKKLNNFGYFCNFQKHWPKTNAQEAEIRPIWSPWDPCYDRNFLRFLLIFGKKMRFYSNTNAMIKFLQKLAVACAKPANFYANLFGENIFTIITSVPGDEVEVCRRCSI